MQHTTVMVTGVGGGAIGGQILSALSQATTPYRVVAADAQPFSHGLYLGHESVVLPLASRPEYISAVLDCIRRFGVNALIPGTEAELNRLVPHASTLQGHGCTLVANPEPVVALCAHKGRLTQWLLEHGFSTPKTADAGNWRALLEETGFPLVGKPAMDTGGSKGVRLLCDTAEVEEFLALTRGELLLQEYVADGDSEYTVGIMADKDGALIDSIVIHRKLTGLSLGTTRTHAGKTYSLSTGISQGFVVTNPFIQRRCEELVLAMGGRGPMNVQCRLSRNDIQVFEVHARFSGTCAIRASAGFNEVDLLLRNFLTGERFGRIPYARDVAAIRGLSHVLVPRHAYRGEFPEEPCEPSW